MTGVLTAGAGAEPLYRVKSNGCDENDQPDVEQELQGLNGDADDEQELLKLPDEDLEAAMLADDEQGLDLRQIRPFAGALTPEDRLTAMKKVQLLEKA